jgi:hypothetical protein
MVRFTGRRDNIEQFLADLFDEMEAKQPGETAPAAAGIRSR